jgi:hypothetical protein
MTDRDTIVAILSSPEWGRENYIPDWPDDEAEAYREFGWERGRAAARLILNGKIADAILAAGFGATSDVVLPLDPEPWVRGWASPFVGDRFAKRLHDTDRFSPQSGYEPDYSKGWPRGSSRRTSAPLSRRPFRR